MAVNKKHAFKPDEVMMADFAKALAHPARIAILKVLASKDACICGELVDELPLSQSTVSQHLKELRSAGLIKGTIDGPRSCYCIDRENLLRLLTHFNELANTFTREMNGTNCC